MYCRSTPVLTRIYHKKGHVKQYRSTTTPSCLVKTTFDFNGDEEDKRKKKHSRLNKNDNMQCDHTCPSSNRGKIEELNMMFYRNTKLITGEDIIRWVREKWGVTLDMELASEDGQMHLVIFSHKMDGPTYKNHIDKIADKISDWMLSDFLHAEIKTHPATYRKGLWNHNSAKVFVTIPLGIYFSTDGVRGV